MDEIGKIRRAHYREGRSIKAISRDLSVTRATVQKVLRSGATAFSYERRAQQRLKIGPWESELEDLSEKNESLPAHACIRSAMLVPLTKSTESQQNCQHSPVKRARAASKNCQLQWAKT